MKKRAPVVDQAALMAAQSQSFIEGQRVWVPNTSPSPSSSSSTWSCGTIVGVSRSAEEVVTLTVKLEGKTQDATVSVPAMQCFLQNETDPDDLTKSDYLHEPGILHTLRARFDLDSIYTYSGQILIALNPFKPLKHLYGPRMMTAFKGGGLEDLSPHCYAVAEAAYAQMMIEGHRQAVLISGESGAGKTVTARMCMAYLAERSGQGAAMAMPIEQQVLESNPLLEAFGNAKTVRNDNSSRFGKYIEMDFSLEGRLNGAHVSTYLLERSRVVSISADERSFHIFYQLLAGCPEGLRERLFLPGVNVGTSSSSSFAYLAQSSVTTLAGTDDRAAFEETVAAMKVIGLDEEQIEAVLEVVSAVLHLGNIRFEGAMDAKADEAVVCSDETSLRSLHHAATLLGTSPEELRRALMSRKITIGGEVIVKEFNVLESVESRDSLSKALYGRLFDWIVAAVNEKIGRVGGGGRSPRTIGILDIYGFESFETNSFEQLCINLANEKLQQSFNEHVFKEEQKVYVEEGIDWSWVDFVDNQDVLDLLEGGTGTAVGAGAGGGANGVPPKVGVFPLLDEACRLPRATNKDLALTIREKLQNHPRFSAPKRDPSTFCISHYAGEVRYDTSASMLERNRDYTISEHETLLAGSSRWMPRALGEIAAARAPDGKDEQRSGFRLSTIGSTFCKQLNVLAGKLAQVEPHYIRCVKPNELSVPGSLEPSYVMDQLRAGGVLEAVRIACAGFPTRKDFAPFARRYIMLADREDLAKGGFPLTEGGAIDWLSLSLEQEAGVVDRIMRATGLEGWQLGRSKLFLRTGHLASLEAARGLVLTDAVVRIQTSWRAYAARFRYQRIVREQKAALYIQAFWRMRRLRDQYEAARKLQREAVAATRIQAVWRMASARRSFVAQCSFLEELARQEAAAAEAAAVEAEREAARLAAVEAEEARLAAASRRASALETENEALRAEVASLKSTIADLECKLAESMSASVEATQASEETRASAMQDLHDKMEQLNMRHADEINVLRESLSNSTSAWKCREEELDRAIAVKDAEMARLVERLEQLEGELTSFRAQADGRAEELRLQQEAAAEASRQVARLEERLEAEKSASSQRTTTIRALRNDNAVMSSRIDALLQQLERAEVDIAQLRLHHHHQQQAVAAVHLSLSRGVSRSASLDIERPAYALNSGLIEHGAEPTLPSLDDDKAALVDLVVRHLVKQPSAVVSLREDVPLPLNGWRLRNVFRHLCDDPQWNAAEILGAAAAIAREIPSDTFSACLSSLNLVIAASALLKVDAVGQSHTQREASIKLLETPQLWVSLAQFVTDKVPIQVGSLLKEDARKSARIRGSKAAELDPASMQSIEGRLECMGSSSKDWMRLIASLDTLVFMLLDACMPSSTAKAILWATLRYIDGTILNALLMRRELCSVSSAKAILTALAIIQDYMATYRIVTISTTEFREAFQRTLQACCFLTEWWEDAVRQARGGMQMGGNSALAKCSALALLQLRRIAEQRHDDWLPSFGPNTETTILLQALKSMEAEEVDSGEVEEATGTATPQKRRLFSPIPSEVMPSPMSDVAEDDDKDQILVDCQVEFALYRRRTTKRMLRETSMAFWGGDGSGGLSAIDACCGAARVGAGLPTELTDLCGA